MICYKDRTFCSKPCDNRDCKDIKTISLIVDSTSFGLPLALDDYSDTCEKYIEPKIKCVQCDLGLLQSEVVIDFGADRCPNCNSPLTEKDDE